MRLRREVALDGAAALGRQGFLDAAQGLLGAARAGVGPARFAEAQLRVRLAQARTCLDECCACLFECYLRGRAQRPACVAGKPCRRMHSTLMLFST